MTNSVNSNTTRSIFPQLLRAGLLLSLFLTIIFTLRVCNLHNEFNHQQQKDKQQTKPDRPKTETQLLFESLMKNKQLIKIEADGRIKLPAKDYILARKVAGQAISDEEESLLGRLYYSIAVLG